MFPDGVGQFFTKEVTFGLDVGNKSIHAQQTVCKYLQVCKKIQRCVLGEVKYLQTVEAWCFKWAEAQVEVWGPKELGTIEVFK